MMKLRLCFCFLALTAVFMSDAAAAGSGADKSAVSRGEMEAVIHDYLLAHPEVITEALQLQQQKAAEAREAAAKQALSAHHDELFADPYSPVIGDPSGDVTVVEFFDYRCEYCRGSEPSVEAVLANDKKVRLVLKEFPILGPDSLLAAKSSLAARKMGHYKEFHTALMAAPEVDASSIDALAAKLGFDMAQFHALRDSKAVTAELEKNRMLADALGIGGTPAFIIGDRLVPGAADAGTLAADIAEVRNNHSIESKK